MHLFVNLNTDRFDGHITPPEQTFIKIVDKILSIKYHRLYRLSIDYLTLDNSLSSKCDIFRVMAKNLDSFWQWVEKRMDELEIRSIHELARRAGMSHGTINAQKNHAKPLTFKMAEGLCQALKVDFVELLTQAGYIKPLPAKSDLQGLDAEIYLALSGKDDEFKRAVLKIIKILLSITPPP